MQQAATNDHNHDRAVPPHVERRYQPDNPDRMDFASAEERLLSMAVKRAVEKSPEIDNLPDFHYVCTVGTILPRPPPGSWRWRGRGPEHVRNYHRGTAEHMQTFRNEYGILDTRADSVRGIAEILNLLGPTVFLKFLFQCS